MTELAMGIRTLSETFNSQLDQTRAMLINERRRRANERVLDTKVLKRLVKEVCQPPLFTYPSS